MPGPASSMSRIDSPAVQRAAHRPHRSSAATSPGAASLGCEHLPPPQSTPVARGLPPGIGAASPGTAGRRPSPPPQPGHSRQPSGPLPTPAGIIDSSPRLLHVSSATTRRVQRNALMRPKSRVIPKTGRFRAISRGCLDAGCHRQAPGCRRRPDRHGRSGLRCPSRGHTSMCNALSRSGKVDLRPSKASAPWSTRSPTSLCGKRIPGDARSARDCTRIGIRDWLPTGRYGRIATGR